MGHPGRLYCLVTDCAEIGVVSPVFLVRPVGHPTAAPAVLAPAFTVCRAHQEAFRGPAFMTPAKAQGTLAGIERALAAQGLGKPDWENAEARFVTAGASPYSCITGKDIPEGAEVEGYLQIDHRSAP